MPGQLTIFDSNKIKSMTIGRSYTCALSKDDEVFCWGGEYGQQATKILSF